MSAKEPFWTTSPVASITGGYLNFEILTTNLDVIVIELRCVTYLGPYHERQYIRDYNGDNAKYRGVALLHSEQLGYYKSLCTGALITPPPGVNGHFVLTAAHCFWDHNIPFPDPDQPDPNFKKWNPNIDQMSFHFGVLKQGRLDGDAVECGIEKVMIPKEYTQTAKPDIAVVKLKGNPPPNHPFQLHMFTNNENKGERTVRGIKKPATRYSLPGYGGRRSPEVTPLTFKDYWGGVVKCHGAARSGDSGAPVLNADGKIVGVMKEIYPQPAISQEPRNENGGAVLPKLERIEPSFTAITENVLVDINKMMNGMYDEVEIKAFAARGAHYGDGMFSILCTFLFPIIDSDQTHLIV